MTEQSTFFWYDEAMEDPLAWHHEWLAAVGLQLPNHVVEATVQAALAHEFDFPTKGVDPHPGEHKAASVKRSYREEVEAHTLVYMDTVLRQWLPPPLLAKFNVPLAIEERKEVVAVSPRDTMASSARCQEIAILWGIFVVAGLTLISCACRKRNSRHHTML